MESSNNTLRLGVSPQRERYCTWLHVFCFWKLNFFMKKLWNERLDSDETMVTEGVGQQLGSTPLHNLLASLKWSQVQWSTNWFVLWWLGHGASHCYIFHLSSDDSYKKPMTQLVTSEINNHTSIRIVGHSYWDQGPKVCWKGTVITDLWSFAIYWFHLCATLAKTTKSLCNK